SVCVAGLVTDELENTVSQISELGQARGLAVRADISDSVQVDALIAAADRRFGRIDAVVPNAGIIPLGGLVHEISLDDWRRTIEVNLTGTFLTVAAAARY